MSQPSSAPPGTLPAAGSKRTPVIARFLRLALLLASNVLLLALLLRWSFDDPSQAVLLQPTSIQWLQDEQGGRVPDPSATGRAVELPWKPASAAGGCWLRLRYWLAAPDRLEVAAYFSYLAPGARVYLNGSEIGRASGPVTAMQNAWSVPAYFPLTASLLQPGENRIDIRLDGANGGVMDVGRIRVGADDSMRPLYKQRLRIQSMGVQIVCLLVLLMGAINTLIWWRRRQDLAYGLAGLSSVFSVLHNLEYFLDDPPLPVPLYLIVCQASGFWLAALLVHACDIVLQRRHRWMTQCGYGLAVVATAMLAVAGNGGWMALPDVLLLLLQGALAIVLMVRAWQSQRIAHGLLWCAVMITTMAGIHQFLLVLDPVRVPDVNLLPYGWLLCSRAISWLLVDGFIQTHKEREAINLALERRIEVFGRELEAQYSRIAELERRNARTAERERIVRDMHDGLGFHLITALNRMTGRSLAPPELAEVFSNALAELENALQATAPERNDLLHALGELRARVESGLREAGIALSWRVAPGTRSPDLGPAGVQEAVRIVQEALTNAIKHSQSATVQLLAQAEADGVTRIRVVDEGVGIGVAAGGAGQAGEGMNSMRWRAERIGGRLDFFSRPGRTEVVLTLPAAAAG